MAFDYKKEYKEFYMPKNKPEIITVPSMNFIAVRGQGDPNQENGEYKQSIGLLYGVAFTIKMSKKGNHQIEGYFDYVVPVFPISSQKLILTGLLRRLQRRKRQISQRLNF